MKHRLHMKLASLEPRGTAVGTNMSVNHCLMVKGGDGEVDRTSLSRWFQSAKGESADN